MKLLFALAMAAVALAAQPAHNAVLTVSWIQGTGGTADHLNFKRSIAVTGPFVTIGTVPIPVLNPPSSYTFTDTSGTGNILTEGTTYFWVATAASTVNSTESANSNIASATIPFTTPQAPTSLSVQVH